MRKPLRVVLTTAAVLVALPALFLTTTTVVNAIATPVESASITPYGHRVEVDGKKMNVVVSGHGPQTIVLLPGLGTAAPGLDFRPLIDKLSPRYRVVAVEPFGTGLSDPTSVPRTAANIDREVHAALQKLHITRYVLMGHSIAGIYALTYSAMYSHELIAFIGIDSSVPGQPGGDQPLPTGTLATLRDLGITRLLSALAPDPYKGLPYSDATRHQLRLLSLKNVAAPTMIDEMAHTPANFTAARHLVFPTDLPVLLFVQAHNTDVAGWIELHQWQAASVEHGRVIILDGEHYLHHTQSAAIAHDTEEFLTTLSLG